MLETTTNDRIIRKFRETICSVLGPRLHEMWLFGSRARGDHGPDSDFDFLIVADGEKTKLRELVTDIENEIMLTTGELLASVIYTTEEWHWANKAPLAITVQHEGSRIA